ncbi:hypothetical protein HDU93_005016 [Gonapodya sp. JEL0774]|nr:hypothetical protein HDU93_005016 [Gonapodya sp. JEL0774]
MGQRMTSEKLLPGGGRMFPVAGTAQAVPCTVVGPQADRVLQQMEKFRAGLEKENTATVLLGADWYEKRILPLPEAQRWGVWGIVVSVVISGEIFGWNAALLDGWGNFLLATVIVTYMMFAVTVSLAELVSALPFSGGPGVFAHAAFSGSYLARGVIGYAYIFEYAVATALNVTAFCRLTFSVNRRMVFVADSHLVSAEAITIITGLSNRFEPMWWLMAYVILTFICCQPLMPLFTFAFWIALISIVGVVSLTLAAVPGVKFEFVSQGVSYFEGGMPGLIRCCTYSVWFYLGVEMFPMMAEETKTTVVENPRGAQLQIATLTTIVILVFFVSIPSSPVLEYAQMTFPVGETLLHVYNLQDTPWGLPLIMSLQLPILLASAFGMLYTCSRHIYTLSRSGYMPPVLSLTDNGNGTPRNAAFTSAFLALIISFILWVLPKDSPLLDVLLNVAALYTLLAFVIDMLAFIRIRQILPTLPRPFKSPLGVFGAVSVVILALSIVIGGMVINPTFQYCAVVMVVQFILLAPYYYFVVLPRVKGRTVEKPFLQGHLKRLMEESNGGFSSSTVPRSSASSKSTKRTISVKKSVVTEASMNEAHEKDLKDVEIKKENTTARSPAPTHPRSTPNNVNRYGPGRSRANEDTACSDAKGEGLPHKKVGLRVPEKMGWAKNRLVPSPKVVEHNAVYVVANSQLNDVPSTGELHTSLQPQIYEPLTIQPLPVLTFLFALIALVLNAPALAWGNPRYLYPTAILAHNIQTTITRIPPLSAFFDRPSVPHHQLGYMQPSSSPIPSPTAPAPNVEYHEWRYEMRRDMQEIIPGLFVGPHAASKNLDSLRANGITHIIVVRDDEERHILRPHFPGQFVYLEIRASDHPLENLIPHFRQSTAFIDAALNAGGRVLVHCNGGISRSPALVVGYLMESKKMDFPTAYMMVQNRRFCVNPNEGFKSQLKEYEPIYTAREAIRQLNYTADEQAQQGSRRRRAPSEFDEDIEEEMGSAGNRSAPGGVPEEESVHMGEIAETMGVCADTEEPEIPTPGNNSMPQVSKNASKLVDISGQHPMAESRVAFEPEGLSPQRKKPGRKPNPHVEEQKIKRKEQNREAQRHHRERKERYVIELERRIVDLAAQVRSLGGEPIVERHELTESRPVPMKKCASRVRGTSRRHNDSDGDGDDDGVPDQGRRGSRNSLSGGYSPPGSDDTKGQANFAWLQEDTKGLYGNGVSPSLVSITAATGAITLDNSNLATSTGANPSYLAYNTVNNASPNMYDPATMEDLSNSSLLSSFISNANSHVKFPEGANMPSTPASYPQESEISVDQQQLSSIYAGLPPISANQPSTTCVMSTDMQSDPTMEMTLAQFLDRNPTPFPLFMHFSEHILRNNGYPTVPQISNDTNLIESMIREILASTDLNVPVGSDTASLSSPPLSEQVQQPRRVISTPVAAFCGIPQRDADGKSTRFSRCVDSLPSPEVKEHLVALQALGIVDVDELCEE